MARKQMEVRAAMDPEAVRELLAAWDLCHWSLDGDALVPRGLPVRCRVRISDGAVEMDGGLAALIGCPQFQTFANVHEGVRVVNTALFALRSE